MPMTLVDLADYETNDIDALMTPFALEEVAWALRITLGQCAFGIATGDLEANCLVWQRRNWCIKLPSLVDVVRFRSISQLEGYPASPESAKATIDDIIDLQMLFYEYCPDQRDGLGNQMADFIPFMSDESRWVEEFGSECDCFVRVVGVVCQSWRYCLHRLPVALSLELVTSDFETSQMSTNVPVQDEKLPTLFHLSAPGSDATWSKRCSKF